MKSWLYRVFVIDSGWMVWAAGIAGLIFLLFIAGCAPYYHAHVGNDVIPTEGPYDYGYASGGPTVPPYRYREPAYYPTYPAPARQYREQKEFREWRFPASPYYQWSTY